MAARGYYHILPVEAEERAMNRAARRALKYRPRAVEDAVLRINPYALPRPPVKIETRTFTESYEDGQTAEITLTLRTMGVTDQMRAAEEADKLWTLHGVGEAPDYAIAPLPEEGVAPSRILFGMVCLLWICQVVETENDRYTPYEWITILARMPTVQRHAQKWINTLMGLGESERKNSPGAGTGSSSAPRSNSPESTPKSPTAKTSYSEGSTGDSGPSFVTTEKIPAMS